MAVTNITVRPLLKPRTMSNAAVSNSSWPRSSVVGGIDWAGVRPARSPTLTIL